MYEDDLGVSVKVHEDDVNQIVNVIWNEINSIFILFENN